MDRPSKLRFQPRATGALIVIAPAVRMPMTTTEPPKGFDLVSGILTAGAITIKAPVARGWNRNFDGLSINPTLTLSGTTQADVFQKFNDTIWAATGQARLFNLTSAQLQLP